MPQQPRRRPASRQRAIIPTQNSRTTHHPPDHHGMVIPSPSFVTGGLTSEDAALVLVEAASLLNPLPEPFPGSVSSDLHGPNRAAQDLGHSVLSQAFQVPQDQTGSGRFRKFVDVVLETLGHLFLLEPVVRRQLFGQGEGSHALIARQIGLEGNALTVLVRGPASEVVEGEVGRDPEDPGGPGFRAPELFEALVDSQEGFLRQVVGESTIADEAGQVADHASLVLLDDLLERERGNHLSSSTHQDEERGGKVTRQSPRARCGCFYSLSWVSSDDRGPIGHGAVDREKSHSIWLFAAHAQEHALRLDAPDPSGGEVRHHHYLQPAELFGPVALSEPTHDSSPVSPKVHGKSKQPIGPRDRLSSKHFADSQLDPSELVQRDHLPPLPCR